MKKQIRSDFFVGLITLLFFSACSQVANQVQRSAANKTSKEISKKTNKKIEGVFNKDKSDEDKTKTTKKTPTEKAKAPKTEMTVSEDTLQRRTSDFVPGERAIFQDDLVGETIGEFPARWDLGSGSAEVMQFGNSKVIGAVAVNTTVFPLLEKEDFLPEKFTIEFDCYFHNSGNEAYTVDFNNWRYDVTIRGDAMMFKSKIRTNVKDKKGWRHIELSFNKRSLKGYYNDERLLNVPNLKEQPTNIKFKILNSNARSKKYGMIKNVRIAEGAVPLYNRLLTDGKIITNNILFEYNDARLKPSSATEIQKIAQLLQKHPELQISIEGHTDGDGAADFNQALSLRRAESVKNALLAQSIDTSRLSVKGWGASKPLVANTNTENKAKNRRVEFVLNQ